MQRLIRQHVGGADETTPEGTPAATPASMQAEDDATGPWSGATTWAFQSGTRDGETAWFEQCDETTGCLYYANTCVPGC